MLSCNRSPQCDVWHINVLLCQIRRQDSTLACQRATKVPLESRNCGLVVVNSQCVWKRA